MIHQAQLAEKIRTKVVRIISLFTTVKGLIIGSGHAQGRDESPPEHLNQELYFREGVNPSLTIFGRGPTVYIYSVAAIERVSLTPSSTIAALASRNIFSTGYSLLKPFPPKIWMASLATLKAYSVDKILEATAFYFFFFLALVLGLGAGWGAGSKRLARWGLSRMSIADSITSIISRSMVVGNKRRYAFSFWTLLILSSSFVAMSVRPPKKGFLFSAMRGTVVHASTSPAKP
jgi:hypothetical protein